MKRRDLLQAALACTVLPFARWLHADEPEGEQVMTVTGPVAPSKLGKTLPHEHVMVDFIGADKVRPQRYNRDEVYRSVLEHLRAVREAGCETFVDCTPAYLARDPALLKRLSEASGLRVVTNTGYYGARQGKYLPSHVADETAEQLAKRWIAEWSDGIDGTGIRPGLIKIGVDQAPLPEASRKLIRAAARTHLKTGLTIACHTGDGAAAMEEMEILREEGVDPSAWIWVHAQNERDSKLHEQAAMRGGWVEFDGIGGETIDRHVELVGHMKDRGRLGRVLISQDAGWYSVGEPGGGKFRSYTTLFKDFLPALKGRGFSEEEIQRLTVKNPAEALTIGVRAK